MISEIFGYGVAIGILFSACYVMLIKILCDYEERRYKARRRWFCDNCKRKMDYLRELR
jgi:hypothetical protein